jgi:thioredoxin-related protein
MKTNYWIEFLTLFIYNKVFFNFLLFIISFYTSYSQQTEKVDFINVKATVQPISTEKKS